MIARRRFERLRTTTVKLQSSVRAKRGQQQEKRIEGAARLVQSRFRQSRKQRSVGGIRTKQYAKAAHIIQAHVRAYLNSQQDEAVQQRQRQRCGKRPCHPVLRFYALWLLAAIETRFALLIAIYREAAAVSTIEDRVKM